MVNFLIGFACGVAAARSPAYPAVASRAKGAWAAVKAFFANK